MPGLDDLAGNLDGLKDKASQFASEHSDQISDGIEKAGDFVDDKTGGKFAEQVDGAQEGAQNFLNNLGGEENA
ncbi:antitoxin [Glutamicibacter sp. PS]|uniref:antitoxin n=1 Tax=Glutamicibacter TaxID=1742989 RepID=UPI00284C95A8|nr:antitoxin [Glutamicibacter sp. PS]MDR4532493.1 antitoxin [Glutamicibacter sp. PS]